MLRIFKTYYPIRNIFFILGEGLIIYGAVLASAFIIHGCDVFILEQDLALKTLFITVLCQICLYYNNLYDLRTTKSFSELGIRLLQALGFAAILFAAIYYIFPEMSIGDDVFILSTGIIIILVVSWRAIYLQILKRGVWNEKIVILGSSELAHNILDEIGHREDCGYSVEMVVPEPGIDAPEAVPSMQALKTAIFKGGYDGLCDMAQDLNIDKIVISLKERRGRFPIRELLKCRMNGIEVLEGHSFYEMLSGRLLVEHINPGWIIFSDGFKKSLPRRFVKRTGDLILSVISLMCCMPLFLLIAILIKIDSRGPIFFSQERVGEKRKIYNIYKFRSMVRNAEEFSGPVWAEEEDPRITRVGRFLRKWRLDEIPQLWNVLRGDMSFVGPRPEREFFVKKLEELIPYYGERFQVKPGITGWAQINYGYGASIEDAVEKLNYDFFYIKNMTVFMDMVIMFRTIKIVLFGLGR